MTRSLSNLYKQWFVRSQPDNARIINSNEILLDRLEKETALPPEDDGGPGGFTEGIISAETEVVEEGPDPVELAREEAERILAEAQADADGLVSRAQAEAAGIREEARRQGYEEGQLQASREFESLEEELKGRYDEKSRRLDSEYSSQRDSMEKDLVDVIVQVFERVFHIQFDNKKDILLHLVSNAVLNIEGEKKFRIRVSRENAQFLEDNRDGILERVGHNIEIEILEDSAMEGKDCIIETDSGVFDCSLGTQLENLIRDIRSLSS